MEELILELYRRLRLMTYKDMFHRIQEREGSLSATEAFSADIINLLGDPTVTGFASYIGVSQPNATYKVNSLVSKGYVEKLPNEKDRRASVLRTSAKFEGYFQDNSQAVAEAAEALEGRFTPEELESAARVLSAFISHLKS